MDKNKELIREFFKEAVIKEEGGMLTISEVWKDFENFIGKPAPYRLVFDIESHNKIPDSELIMQGSYFLLAIRDYLADKGLTSKLRIITRPNLSESKALKKLRVIETREEGFGYFQEFSFHKTYQYLNVKKQSISKYLMNQGEIIDLDIKRFKTQEAKDEISTMDLEKSYNIAKKRLSADISKEVRTIKPALREKLEGELARVRGHYKKQIKEKDEELARCEEKIKTLRSKLKHTYYDRDIRILNMQIRESEERLEGLKQKSYKKRLEAEESFHITDITEKHVLAIKNHLMNITIYYYPKYRVSAMTGRKKVSLIYDPIFDTVKKTRS
jgi:hypothetical protein